MQTVYIVGSKSLGKYGGFETFVKRLVECHKDKDIKYIIACKANGYGFEDESALEGAKKISEDKFTYCNAECVKIHTPVLGPLQAVLYDSKAIRIFIKHIKQNKVEKPIVYILACRLGFSVGRYARQIRRLGGKVYLNPDGHEWKRGKWPLPIKAYWKFSEQRMVKYSDLIVCDSLAIESYVRNEYAEYIPQTTYIAYGSDVTESLNPMPSIEYERWIKKNQLKQDDYYLLVGRFVPENNYETIIREFMRSKTKKSLVIVTTYNEKFRASLDSKIHFSSDTRVKFVGTVYDPPLLREIRANAFAYIHGHEVGGTNPSLLEALGTTKLNLLYDVCFNREVGSDAALYWNKSEDNLSVLINKVEAYTLGEIDILASKAKERISKDYSWRLIADKYEKLWLNR